MIIKFKIENGKPFLTIKYENEEWQKIESILKELGLEVRETNNGFGMNYKLKFYRETNEELLRYIRNTFTTTIYNLFDDINRRLYDNGYLNLAIFRVIPENGEVKAPVDKYLTILEFKNIIETIVKIYRILLNLAINKEVKVLVKEEW